ncbi:MAG: metal-sulfur cluster assembly factor [Chloroflexota bacterium]
MSIVRPRPVWKVTQTHPELVSPLDEAFRQVMDPELGLNIMEIGLIRDVSIDNENNSCHVIMIMTTPFCPYAPALLESARSKAEGVSEKETTIEMGMEPWDPTYMEDGVGADWGLF